MADNGLFEYTVALIPRAKGGTYTRKDFIYDPTTPFRDLMVDTKVPRRAIRWIEKPLQDDEHVSLLLVLRCWVVYSCCRPFAGWVPFCFLPVAIQLGASTLISQQNPFLLLLS